MRQLITLAALLSFLTAQQVHPKYGMEGIPKKVLAEQRNSESRTEQFELYMADSYGDGWNGASISALDCAGNTVLGPLTLESGSEAIVSLCLNLDQAGALLPGATVVAGGGTYDSEISWS